MPGKEAGDFVQFKVVEVESETGPCQAIELLNVDLAIDFLPPTDAPITPLAGQPPGKGFSFFSDVNVCVHTSMCVCLAECRPNLVCLTSWVTFSSSLPPSPTYTHFSLLSSCFH